MDGSRIPKYEETFLKRQEELEILRAREARRRDRKSNIWGPGGFQRAVDDVARHQTSLMSRKTNNSLT